jgi:hypothetical protein
MQVWICRTSGKIFLVDQNQEGLNPAVVEEFEAARTPQKKKRPRFFSSLGPKARIHGSIEPWKKERGRT